MQHRLQEFDYEELAMSLGVTLVHMAARTTDASAWRCPQGHLISRSYDQLRRKPYGWCPTCIENEKRAASKAQEEEGLEEILANLSLAQASVRAKQEEPSNAALPPEGSDFWKRNILSSSTPNHHTQQLAAASPADTKIIDLRFNLPEVQLARMLYFFKNPRDNKTPPIKTISDLRQYNREYLIRKVGLTVQMANAIEQALMKVSNK